MKNNIMLFALMFPFWLMAQDREVIKGRALADSIGMPDVLVVNFSGETETRTDNFGNFNIRAKTGDLLILSGNAIISKRIRYTQDLVAGGIVLLAVQPAAMELEEVVITKYNNITAEKLGIVPKGQKRYTPAERRLKAASSMKPVFYMGTMPGIGLPTDAIINAITGRTKMLKKALVAERKLYDIEKLKALYTNEEIMDKFKIPAENVEGFLYYAVEDAVLKSELKNGRKELIALALSGLAVKYVDLLHEK